MVDWRGDWALVTGASSGIGREFAVQLAAAGMNVVLVARRRALLEGLADELRRKSDAGSLIVAEDLGRAGAPEAIENRLQQAGVRIRLLVNNAGIGRWGRFEKVTADEYDQVLRVNNAAMVGLCRVLFPHLSSFDDSAVINVSSQAAYQPVPFMAVYAASKAFVQSFSVALFEEWRNYGIRVTALVPGPTLTEFDAKAGAYESAIGERRSPGEAVAAALTALGGEKPVIAAVKGVSRQRILGGLLPQKLLVRQVAKMFRPPEGR